jgi:hypothetical protein
VYYHRPPRPAASRCCSASAVAVVAAAAAAAAAFSTVAAASPEHLAVASASVAFAVPAIRFFASPLLPKICSSSGFHLYNGIMKKRHKKTMKLFSEIKMLPSINESRLSEMSNDYNLRPDTGVILRRAV